MGSIIYVEGKEISAFSEHTWKKVNNNALGEKVLVPFKLSLTSFVVIMNVGIKRVDCMNAVNIFQKYEKVLFSACV